MKRLAVIICSLIFTSMITNAQKPKDFAAAWDAGHVSRILPSNVRHKDLKIYLEELKKLGIKVDEVGRSYGNREIYQMEWGTGKAKVFMWSQMHGDEPTATSALIDLFAFLQKNQDKIAWVKRLSETFAIRAVPMLNPDGAELYQRRNLQFIDINRDARRLETPEGQLLKKLRDQWQPEIGFNLHNQNALTTVDGTKNQATISLLAVSGDENGRSNEGHRRSKRICGVMINALNEFIKGHIGRYDDEYNPRAFGDMISAWGTPVILVETGALVGKDEMFLVRLNFIAYLAALQSIVDGTDKTSPETIYENTPFNGDGIYGFLFKKANIVNPRETTEPFIADIAINAERRRAEETAPTFVQEIGDLSVFGALETIDSSQYFVVSKSGLLRIGSPGDLLFYKKTRKIDFAVPDLEETFPPDGVFSHGKWVKPLGN